MSGRLAAMAALACIASGLPEGNTVLAAAHPTLIVMPKEGHVGDSVYLSGSGFPDNTEMSASFACRSGNGSVQRWVFGRFSGRFRTDHHGQFVAHRTRFGGRLALPAACTINARTVSGRGTSKYASAGYRLLATRQPLGSCSTHICLSVTGFLVRLESGVWGHIVVRGWPGASVNVTVQVPSEAAKRNLVRLDWDGMAALKLWVAPGLQRGLKARIQVRARLGHVSGGGTGRFYVLPGGR